MAKLVINYILFQQQKHQGCFSRFEIITMAFELSGSEQLMNIKL